MQTFIRIVGVILILLVVLAFIGVEPLSSYKDAIVKQVEQVASSRSPSEPESSSKEDEPPIVGGPTKPTPYIPMPKTSPLPPTTKEDIPPTVSPIVILQKDESLVATVQLNFSNSSRYGIYYVTLFSKVEREGAVYNIEKEIRTKTVKWEAKADSVVSLYYNIVEGTQAYRFISDGENPEKILRVVVNFEPQEIISGTEELETLEGDIIAFLNRKRANEGLTSLDRDYSLETEADSISREMAKMDTIIRNKRIIGAVVLTLVSEESRVERIAGKWIAETKYSNIIFDLMSTASISIATINEKKLFVTLILTPDLSSVELETHFLINKVREKEGLRWTRWDKNMYVYAKNQSSISAREGSLVHSHREALSGGENLWMSDSTSLSDLPRAVVLTWLNSPEHSKWLLDGTVNRAAVGITQSEYGTFVAWSFSD